MADVTLSTRPPEHNIFTEGIVRNVAFVADQVREQLPIPTDALIRQAFHTLSYALNWPAAWPDARELLLELATPLEQAGYRGEWQTLLADGIRQSEALYDTVAACDLHHHLGTLYHLQAEDAAQSHFEASAAYAEQLQDKVRQARALNRQALVARRRHQLTYATELANKGLRLAEEAASAAEIGFSYYALGGIALDAQQHEEAYQQFTRSLQAWKETNNPRWSAWGLSNLSTALLRLGRRDEAIADCEKAIEMLTALRDPLNQAITLMNLGNIYLMSNEPQQALEYYEKAKPLMQQVNSQMNLAMLFNNFGMAYCKLKQWEAAEEAYEMSISLWQRLGNISRMVNDMDNLAILYGDWGKPERATDLLHEALQQLEQIRAEADYHSMREMLLKTLRSIPGDKSDPGT